MSDLDYKMLTVEVSEGLTPYIQCDTEDILHRGDGRGSFKRIFRADNALNLTAQPIYGKLTFVRWVDERKQ